MGKHQPPDYGRLSGEHRESLILLNCAGCSRELSAPNQIHEPGDPEIAAGRCQDRPWCWRCLPRVRKKPLEPGIGRMAGLVEVG